MPSIFIFFVFIRPIFKLLLLWEALQGARIPNKTLIKVRKHFGLGIAGVTCRINGASFGGPSDMTLPASLDDRDLMGMLCSCCVSLGKHLSFSRPQFPHFS